MHETITELEGQLLVAMPTLEDPNFWRTVVFIAVHNAEEGAFGLVLNRPLEVPMADVLRELGHEVPDPGALPPVMAGGPVEPTHGFVLFEGGEGTDGTRLEIGPGLVLSGETETLFGLADGRIPGRFLLFLGYSGWAPGQLEREIEENSWLVAPFSTELLFETPPARRWHAALRSIGVDPGTLVDAGGAAPS